MQYAIVEIFGEEAENNKLLAVPETWIICKNKTIKCLYWPNVKSVGELNAMIENGRITPSAAWKKLACKIIYQSIASFKSAQKILEILQKQHKMNARVIARKMLKNEHEEPNRSQINAPDREVRKIVAKNQQCASVPDLDNCVNAKQEEDPFGNLPVPPLVQTIQSKMSTEDMYTFCKTKKEKDPLGDLYTATSRSNVATDKNWIPSKSPANAASAVGEDDAQNCSSRTMRQSELDPPKDVKHPPQLYDLIYELKSVMIRNQEEVKQNIREGFNRLEKTILSLIKQNEHMPSKILHKLNGTAGQNDFHLDNLKTVEDVNRFEDQLRNEEYWKKIQTFVDCTIHYETRPMKRMKLMFDRLFDRQLLPQLNWSGKFGKNPFKYYFNIRNLFEYIGTTPTHHSNGVEVTKFFINTLQYVVRVPSTVASSGNDIDTTQKETIPNVQVEAAAQNDTMEQSKQIRQDEMVEEDERHEPEESMEHDESALDEGQTLSEVESVANASENSFVEKHVNRITCVEELDTLENQLNDLKVKQHLHRWIEETVGLEANVEKRMSVLLDQLMDRKVLQTFSWVDENSEKRPLQRYQNFVKLFEYASRTMIHQTIVYNHRYVSNFFTNCIKEQCST